LFFVKLVGTKMKRFARLVAFALVILPLVGNAGENEWTYVGLYPEMVTDIIVHPNNPDILYVSAFDVFYDTTREGGIFKTTDHGLTWDTLGFRHYRVNDLAFDPQHPETLWAACEVSGAFRSTDGGASWENRSEGLYLGGVDDFGALAIAVSPFDPSLLICGGGSDVADGWLYRSTDGGALWTWIDVDWGYCYKVVFDSLFPGRILVLDNFHVLRIWVSEDSGISFRQVPGNQDVADLALDPFRQNWLWSMGSRSFLYSPDAGSTWIEPDTSFPPQGYLGLFAEVSQDRLNRVYTTTSGRVFQTRDGGLTWLELLAGWPTQSRSIDAISVVARRPDELWAGLYYHGILSYTAIDSTGGIDSFGEEPLGFGLDVWPNPATSVVYLSMSQRAVSGTFSLYNILGQTVLSVALRHDNRVQAIVFPNALPSGTYFAAFVPNEQAGDLLVKTHRIVILK
jgi:photosystem II stability/assembly factor-like uncharacterized protein